MNERNNLYGRKKTENKRNFDEWENVAKKVENAEKKNVKLILYRMKVIFKFEERKIQMETMKMKKKKKSKKKLADMSMQKKKDIISSRTSVRACAHRDIKLRVSITYLR